MCERIAVGKKRQRHTDAGLSGQMPAHGLALQRDFLAVEFVVVGVVVRYGVEM